jgi:hypothetical protein
MFLSVVRLEYPIAKLQLVDKKAGLISFSEAIGDFGLGFWPVRFRASWRL